MWTVLSLPFATGCNMGVDIICKVLRTVKARGLYSCSQRSYQLVSVKYMIMNIISRTLALYYPYTLYRESWALGWVNKEAICRNVNQPYKGFSWVSVNSTKVTKPPENLLEWVNRERRRYQLFGWPAVGMKRQLSIVERKVLNMSLK